MTDSKGHKVLVCDNGTGVSEMVNALLPFSYHPFKTEATLIALLYGCTKIIINN